MLRYGGVAKNILSYLFVAVILLLPAHVLGQQTPPVKEAPQGSQSPPKPIDYTKGITKKGKNIIVSKWLVDKVRADNNIILSGVTFKASVDKTGKGNGFKIVAVDRGSVVQKLGIMTNDIVQELNGFRLTSSNDVEKADAALKDSTKFKLKVLRKGRVKTLYYEIK